MRHFGMLHGRASRGIGTQAALRYYRSPVYMQDNTGYVYTTYGNPNASPMQTSVYAAEYHERDTNKYDVWQSAVNAAGQIGTQITQGQYALKGAAIGAQTPSALPPPSTGSSSAGLIIGGLVVAAGLGFIAYMALKS